MKRNPSGTATPARVPFLQPVRTRQTVQDHVYTALRSALMTGRFDPGQVLTIDMLAHSFGVSHMPVREALRRLAAERALEPAANGSLLVPVISLARLDDLVQARLAVETLATERAARFMAPSSLKSLRVKMMAHAATTSENGVEELLRRNQEFHFQLYEASGSEVYVSLIEALWLRFGPYLRLLSRVIAPRLNDPDFGNGAQHHRAVVAGLEAGDATAATEAIAADIQATYELLRPLICELAETDPALGSEFVSAP
jgi:DNA-binding GntR family transcriptional regulator